MRRRYTRRERKERRARDTASTIQEFASYRTPPEDLTTASGYVSWSFAPSAWQLAFQQFPRAAKRYAIDDLAEIDELAFVAWERGRYPQRLVAATPKMWFERRNRWSGTELTCMLERHPIQQVHDEVLTRREVLLWCPIVDAWCVHRNFLRWDFHAFAHGYSHAAENNDVDVRNVKFDASGNAVVRPIKYRHREIEDEILTFIVAGGLEVAPSSPLNHIVSLLATAQYDIERGLQTSATANTVERYREMLRLPHGVPRIRPLPVRIIDGDYLF